MPWLCPLPLASMTELEAFLSPKNPQDFRLPRIGDLFKWKYSIGGQALVLDIQPAKNLKGWYILKWYYIQVGRSIVEDVYDPLQLEEEYILICEG